MSIQLMTRDGLCLQRIVGQSYDFRHIRGICVYNDRLYVTDAVSKRVHVFKRDK